MVDGDGVEIDFVKLQSATLEEMQKFVNECLNLTDSCSENSDSESSESENSGSENSELENSEFENSDSD